MIFVYCLMIVIGLLPAVLVTRYILLEEKIRKHGAVSIAEITSIQTQRTGSTSRAVLIDNVIMQYPNQFTGDWQQAQLRVKKGKYKYGEKPTVRYLAGKPNRIIDANSKREYWPAIILGAITLLVMVVAVYKIDQQLNFRDVVA